MKIRKKHFRYIYHPKKIMYFLGDLLLDIIGNYISDDRLFIKLKWFFNMDYKLHLNNPKTFNEKLQWLKLNDHNPLYTILVDKIKAKDYVEKILGESYIIPTISVFSCAKDINWDNLPQKFVLKCTHNSAGVVVCNDKNNLDRVQTSQNLEQGLKASYYLRNREWPYLNVPRMIICEQYMEDESGFELKDYKFFCFNGKVKVFKIDFGRKVEHRANYYSRDLKLLDFGEVICPPDSNKLIVFPDNILEMFNVAEKLSVGFPFLRVDLYNVKGHIYFGELTLYPASGFGKFTDRCWDDKFGEWLSLPI